MIGITIPIMKSIEALAELAVFLLLFLSSEN